MFVESGISRSESARLEAVSVLPAACGLSLLSCANKSIPRLLIGDSGSTSEDAVGAFEVPVSLPEKSTRSCLDPIS
jgi:hypothetical protein